jgi:hypothetical protein
MKGYKVFNPDWTCRGFQFKVGKTYEEDVTPSCCIRGFHFCTELKECFSYYSFDPNNKVAEIEALGEIDAESDENKHCTNKIKIVREISWEEVLKMVNMGKANTGLCNSGNHNTGNHNSGDWNYTNCSCGCFNTEEPKIFMFNKPSNWTIEDWYHSKAMIILDRFHNNSLQWIPATRMTKEEKEQYPDYEILGGYLRKQNNLESNQLYWDKLSKWEKKIVKSLPNFDAVIFKKITGIDVNKDLNN